MGRDKALLELAGKPLIQHAVVKLRRVCAEVAVLGNNPELEVFAPLVRDVHEGCGPMSGMEAALLHTRYDWNLFLPVDVPFVPTAYLDSWVRTVLPSAERRGARVLMFMVGEVPQPTLALVRREARPFLSEALERGEYKLFPALERGARELAVRDGFAPGAGLWNLAYGSDFRAGPGFAGREEGWFYTTEAQERNHGMWFKNVNTPEEFAEVAEFEDVLDT